jgi:hypothetical protein
MAKISEMLVDLSEQRLLLCDLSPERTYINTTTGSVVISAGKAQWTYSANRRYHSDAWCFSHAQCEACFKTSHEQPMAWLPEAQCSAETKQCIVSVHPYLRFPAKPSLHCIPCDDSCFVYIFGTQQFHC